MKKEKINFAIIGAGKMCVEYSKAINSQKHNLHAIYSRTFKKAKLISTRFKFKKIYKSLNFLKNDKKIDIIIICVSEENVGKIIKKLANSKKIILIEKPIGLSFYQSTKIIQFTKKYLKRSFIALNRRYYPSTLDLVKILKKMKSNKKRILEVFDCQDKKRFKRLKKHPKVINSMMYANSVHLIDYFDLFCRGNLIRASSLTNNFRNPNIIFSKLEYSSGDIGFYHCSWNQNSRWKVKLTLNNYKEWTLQPLESLSEHDLKKNKQNFYKSYNYKFKPGLIGLIQDIIRENDNKKNNLIKPQMHLKTISTIKKIYGV